jgi:filamentous hemagglutinin family protein
VSQTVTSLVRSASLIACMAALNPAAAAPAGGTITAGNATISSNAATTTITQTSDRAVINWNSFNIGATETVTFAQPNAQAAALNRVTGSQLSSLQGTLNANGQVYLVNPNGVLIGSGAHVNVASFIATTASIADSKFMTSTAAANGRYDFNELTSASSAGTIVNEGTITVAEGGIAALVAPAVKNTGIIAARLGTIELASATRFTLDLFGDDLVRVAVGDSLASALSDVQGNSVKAQVNAGGQLQADGGRIVLLAVPAATGLVDDAINLSGVARAVSVGAGNRGEILLLSNQGRITIGGTADASASGAAIGGGTVTAMGHEVHVTPTGRINASAAGDGGSIVLGGTYSADGATATSTTIVDAGAVLTACGTVACATDGTGGAGAGGKVRLYSTNGTRLAGSIDVSSSADKQAGTVELLSNAGLTELASTSRIRARSGVGSFAGFVIGVGETLSVSPDAFVDLRDVQDGFPIEINRAIYDGDANTPQYGQSPDDDGIPGPDLPRLGTAYDAAIPALGINLLASSLTTPVGTVRPNGGAPMTLAASGADALAPIPVSFANAPRPPPLLPPPPPVADPGSSQVADTVSRLALDTFVDFFGLNLVALPPRDTGGPLPVMAGGPGVARSADLGRNGDAAGAATDVFGVNHHVLAPDSDKQDPGVSEYLCKTPYSHNGCKQK